MSTTVIDQDTSGHATLSWASAARDTARDITAGQLDDPLRHVAHQALEAADADRVIVVTPGASDDTVVASTAVGLEAGSWDGCILDARVSRAATVLRSGDPVRFAEPITHPVTGTLAAEHMLLVPLCDSVGVRAVVSIGRMNGRRPFTDTDLALAAMFAGQIAFALELADGPARRDRAVRVHERDRIARELTNHVIGRLFALGMALQGAAADAAPASKRQFETCADEIDETVKQIRSTIYRLAVQPPGSSR